MPIDTSSSDVLATMVANEYAGDDQEVTKEEEEDGGTVDHDDDDEEECDQEALEDDEEEDGDDSMVPPDKSEVLRRWENFPSECCFWRHLHTYEKLYYFRKICGSSYLEKHMAFPDFQRMTKSGGTADGKCNNAGMAEYISGDWIDESSQVHLRHSSREGQTAREFINGDTAVLNVWRSMGARVPGFDALDWKQRLWIFREVTESPGTHRSPQLDPLLLMLDVRGAVDVRAPKQLQRLADYVC